MSKRLPHPILLWPPFAVPFKTRCLSGVSDEASAEGPPCTSLPLLPPGKKGVEIEGASDMGGLDFFCTTMELPDGDTDLLLMSMDAMNADPDPDAEDRKGCSGHVGKMIYSAGVTQVS